MILTNTPGTLQQSRCPECVILAGPNGAGKSTIFRTVEFAGEFVNADNVARDLNRANPEAASIAAGWLVLDRLRELVESRPDFVYENTLSSHQSINLMRKARAAGYSVLLIFVALENADWHILRVAQRVKLGGHHIPEDSIRRRYETSIANLAIAADASDHVIVFDNSPESGPRQVLALSDGRVASYELTGSAFDRRIATALVHYLT